MVKKRNLTLEKIIEASISLINEKGLHALTMRALAAKLGVQASAVYWHVKNKEELLQQLSSVISKQVNFPKQEWDWKMKMMFLANESKEAMSSIRSGPEIMMQTIPSDPYRLEIIEYMLNVLIEVGFTPLKALEIANLINNYTILYTMDEALQMEQLSDPAFHEHIQGFFVSLKDKYPNFFQAMQEQVQNELSAQKNKDFVSGLQAILDGYELALHN
ncbi:TetR/AcrR family transcriptional regulator C-terminal domain-containing protein [Bacillus horti]|uniref:AcrR family transcriptional regulator n=1 Tax=Caldalkalibacillus horti TaxID=77523 RepID=A0ABT9W5N1_9BACI|nr:TetR/AcrR family transcriptional regulator C-terminal domain-containing protein [Bacillus horti]MDQ0168425.1 AcrR family transcriptional regulator [Bacillus horti]